MRQLTVKLAVISFRRLVLSSLICLLLITNLWHFYSHVFAADSPMQSNPAAEEWIEEQVASGNIADLRGKFPNESDRVISAEFLKRLLANAAEAEIEVHRRGVRIAHAIITEPINLKLAEIPCETRLISFRFEEHVDFSQSIFLKGLSFIGCSFKSADFTGMKVGGSADFQNTAFSSEAIFMEAGIQDDFSSVGSNFTGAAFFYGMKVGRDVNFDDAIFSETVGFTSIEVGRDAYFCKYCFV